MTENPSLKNKSKEANNIEPPIGALIIRTFSPLPARILFLLVGSELRLNQKSNNYDERMLHKMQLEKNRQ